MNFQDLVEIKKKEKNYIISTVQDVIEEKCEKNLEKMNELGKSPLDREFNFRVYFYGLQNRRGSDSYARKTTTKYPEFKTIKSYGKAFGCPPGTKKVIFENYEIPIVYLFGLHVESFHEAIQNDNVFTNYVFTAKNTIQVINRFLKRYFTQYSDLEKNLVIFLLEV